MRDLVNLSESASEVALLDKVFNLIRKFVAEVGRNKGEPVCNFCFSRLFKMFVNGNGGEDNRIIKEGLDKIFPIVCFIFIWGWGADNENS